MHQTFYIDADEEISSVIDRINKSVSKDNYFVVPKRAIFLQSIVNLKLLKREADKLGKILTIVTQDEIGASMAQRSGLAVRSSLDDLEFLDKEIVSRKKEPKQTAVFDEGAGDDDFYEKKHRLSAVGSSEFYDASESVKIRGGQSAASTTKPKGRKIPINSVNSVSKKEGHFKGVGNSLYGNRIDPMKEKSLEKMFSSSGHGNHSQKKEEKQNLEMHGNAKKVFVGFVAMCILLLAGIATYLFLPSAKISLVPSVSTEKIDLVVNGDPGASQVSEAIVPVRIIDKDEEVSLEFDVSGNSASAGKKARGKVVIYNEYNNSPQTLVATTRLESADGKTFRLVKDIVVPGTVSVGGEVKPGAIEVEVIADQPGGEFNIVPTSFSIPGFKGGPKYEKFYAKSTEDFVGGTTEEKNSSGAVSQTDIDKAKQKTEEALNEKLAQGVKSDLKEGEISLEQTQKVTIKKTAASARVGSAAEKLEYSASGSIRALVFLEKDIKKIIEQSVQKRQNMENVKWDVSKIEYAISVADFEKNTLELKIHAEVLIIPMIDTEKIKKELLGKNDDQLSLILRNYPSIKSINIEFSPTFVSRVPQYEGRVDIEIENIPN